MTGERGIPTFQLIVYCYSLRAFLGCNGILSLPWLLICI